MLSCQFQNSVVAVGIVDASHMLVEAVIVCGSLLQLLGHFHPSDEHRTITASNAVLYSCRTHGCGHQEDRVIVRYRDTFGARRPPSSRAPLSHPVFHLRISSSARTRLSPSAKTEQISAARTTSKRGVLSVMPLLRPRTQPTSTNCCKRPRRQIGERQLLLWDGSLWKPVSIQ